MKGRIVALLVLFVGHAWADDQQASPLEGRACETSSECDGLHCVESVCVAIEDGRIRQHAQMRAPISKPMFGDGKGYVVNVVIADIAASATAGLFFGLAVGPAQSGTFAILSVFPTTLAGPIMHLAYERPVPALISFLAWASVPPTSLFVAAVTTARTFNESVTLGVGISTAIACAAGVTAMDAFLARTPSSSEPSTNVVWAPSIVPLPGGFSASVVGRF